MRREFSDAIEKIALEDEKVVFITGDLGYNALENLQKKMGKRFINAGVAEQNMVGLAAGMAYKGFKVFCYSIAPFVVYRCWEQFRNDVCLHNLPVFLVGNGGGYGYGIMGSSHHAIEDLAGLSSLQNVKCWIPAFSDEVEPFVNQIISEGRPAYLRLGAGKQTPSLEKDFDSIKLLAKPNNAKSSIIALGPVVGNVIKVLENEEFKDKFNLFTAYQLPLKVESEAFAIIQQAKNVLVVEEHVSIGGLAQQLSIQLLENGISLNKFISLRAQGYPDGLYGDQGFHQAQSGLDEKNIAEKLRLLLA
ncbi:MULTISPECIES: transketolase [unclassified Arcicella]|uniref:transketolase n=1 Tax=unclassified Arcicella TaxID=2644986 RepID=UPI002856B733|nr:MULTISPECIES: transketolase [unclassified Arcicella]MDR6564043.1 transketolase [Arcicella sp. BE51]MDR6813796.1 transketolase [Arcicella sp. BE140]MDR6825108.1 transketolase [Arcicella sp. BE139]